MCKMTFCWLSYWYINHLFKRNLAMKKYFGSYYPNHTTVCDPRVHPKYNSHHECQKYYHWLPARLWTIFKPASKLIPNFLWSCRMLKHIFKYICTSTLTQNPSTNLKMQQMFTATVSTNKHHNEKGAAHAEYSPT
jgi:hypothetical protein